MHHLPNQNGIQEVEICKKTGKIASDGCKDTYIEYFKKGNVVKEICEGEF